MRYHCSLDAASSHRNAQAARPLLLRLLGFVLLFCALPLSSASAQQASPYEAGVGYRADWLSEGDGQASTIAVSASRYTFSSWTGFTARLAYQRRGEEVSLRRAVTEGVRSPGGERLRTAVADLTFFADLVRFETGAVGHRFRVEAGPSAQVRRGERARGIFFPAYFEDFPPGEREAVKEELREGVGEAYDHLYEGNLSGEDVPTDGFYMLISDDRRGLDYGVATGLSYSLRYRDVTLSLSTRARVYEAQNIGPSLKAFSYGMSLGWQF